MQLNDDQKESSLIWETHRIILVKMLKQMLVEWTIRQCSQGQT